MPGRHWALGIMHCFQTPPLAPPLWERGGEARWNQMLNRLQMSVFSDSEESPLTPLCIEDAERVEDPILFERPCKCIEDARSLVLRLDLPSASQRNFNQLDTSCLAVKVPLRGTFVLLCVDQAARTSGPLAWSFEQIASSKHFSVSDAIGE